MSCCPTREKSINVCEDTLCPFVSTWTIFFSPVQNKIFISHILWK